MEKKTVIFVALRFAEHFSPNFLETIKREHDLRLVAIVDATLVERIPPGIRPHLDQQYETRSEQRLAFWPVFSDAEIREVIDRERAAHPDRAIALVCCDELNIDATGRIRRELGIPGPDDRELLRFRDKRVMKDVLAQHGIRVPKFLHFDADAFMAGTLPFATLAERLGLPFVVKPVDAAGSIGFRIIEGEADLQAYCAGRTFDCELEVEEFIAGDLYHVDSLVLDGEPVFNAVNEYAFPIDTYADGKMMGSITLPDSEPVHAPMIEMAVSALKALGATNLCSHMEIFWSRNEAVFLEVAARPPGGLICRSHELARGVNYVDYDFLIQAGLPFETPVDRGGHVFWTYFPRKDGVVEDLVAPELASDYQIDWRIAKGDVSTYSAQVFDASASLVAQNIDFKALRRDFDRLKHTELVVLAQPALSNA